MSLLKQKDEFGQRMKQYEAMETSRKLDPHLPVYARIDGRGFSKFTRDMERPFDKHMSSCMMETTKYLVDQTHAKIGYVQSDEISLVYHADDPSNIFFEGKIQKMVSVLASMAATRFVTLIDEKYRDRLPHFDCRVFQLPSKVEAANTILWRAMDARKNAISMLAQANFSHKDLQGKDQADMLGMLAMKDIYFEECPDFFKKGTFFQRVSREVDLHDVKTYVTKYPPCVPPGKVIRTRVEAIPMPWFNLVKNRVEVIFNKEKPSEV